MASKQHQMQQLFIDNYADFMVRELQHLEPHENVQLDNLHYYWELMHSRIPKLHVVRRFLLKCKEKDLPHEQFDGDEALEIIQDSTHDWHMALMSKVIDKL